MIENLRIAAPDHVSGAGFYAPPSASAARQGFRKLCHARFCKGISVLDRLARRTGHFAKGVDRYIRGSLYLGSCFLCRPKPIILCHLSAVFLGFLLAVFQDILFDALDIIDTPAVLFGDSFPVLFLPQLLLIFLPGFGHIRFSGLAFTIPFRLVLLMLFFSPAPAGRSVLTQRGGIFHTGIIILPQQGFSVLKT